MSISRRSLIAGVAAGGALMAVNAPAANARNRFVAAAKDPVVKKVSTPRCWSRHQARQQYHVAFRN